jgi:hypothetical protein
MLIHLTANEGNICSNDEEEFVPRKQQKGQESGGGERESGGILEQLTYLRKIIYPVSVFSCSCRFHSADNYGPQSEFQRVHFSLSERCSLFAIISAISKSFCCLLLLPYN